MKSQSFSPELVKHAKEELETLRKKFYGSPFDLQDIKMASYRLIAQSNATYLHPNYANDLLERLHEFLRSTNHLTIPNPDQLGLTMLSNVSAISENVKNMIDYVNMQNRARSINLFLK